MFTLVSVIISIALAILDGVLGTGVLGVLYMLLVLLPSLAVGARRLHDTGRSGWWPLIAVIPFIGAIVLIVFFAIDGHRRPNAYGLDSKLYRVRLPLRRNEAADIFLSILMSSIPVNPLGLYVLTGSTNSTRRCAWRLKTSGWLRPPRISASAGFEKALPTELHGKPTVAVAACYAGPVEDGQRYSCRCEPSAPRRQTRWARSRTRRSTRCSTPRGLRASRATGRRSTSPGCLTPASTCLPTSWCAIPLRSRTSRSSNWAARSRAAVRTRNDTVDMTSRRLRTVMNLRFSIRPHCAGRGA
jgi:Protein of unknown function (DUF805)